MIGGVEFRLGTREFPLSVEHTPLASRKLQASSLRSPGFPCLERA